MRHICSVAGAVMLVGLAACQTVEQQSTETSAVNLSQAEVMAHISGNTEVWTKGGGYYAPNGELNVLWKGQESAGTWSVSDDGEVCYVVEIWGTDKECHRYVNEGGDTKTALRRQIQDC